jgi:hypothetical protein
VCTRVSGQKLSRRLTQVRRFERLMGGLVTVSDRAVSTSRSEAAEDVLSTKLAV